MSHPHEDILLYSDLFLDYSENNDINPPFSSDDPIFLDIREVDRIIANYTLINFSPGDQPKGDKVQYVDYLDIGVAIYLSELYFLRQLVELRMAINSLPLPDTDYYGLVLIEQMTITRSILDCFVNKEYQLVINALIISREEILANWGGKNSRDKDLDNSQLKAAYGLIKIIDALKVTKYPNYESN